MLKDSVITCPRGYRHVVSQPPHSKGKRRIRREAIKASVHQLVAEVRQKQCQQWHQSRTERLPDESAEVNFMS